MYQSRKIKYSAFALSTTVLYQTSYGYTYEASLAFVAHKLIRLKCFHLFVLKKQRKITFPVVYYYSLLGSSNTFYFYYNLFSFSVFKSLFNVVLDVSRQNILTLGPRKAFHLHPPILSQTIANQSVIIYKKAHVFTSFNPSK